MSVTHDRRAQAGFTLIELGVVIGISAILAVSVVPSAMERARLRVAEKATEDVSRLIEAARWFYVESRSDPLATDYHWPGTSPITCAPQGLPWRADLAEKGFLPPTGSRNPWGRDYQLASIFGNSQLSCLLEVKTQVPSAVADAFISNLPGASCAAVGADGFKTCSATVPPPGGGVSLTRAKEQIGKVRDTIEKANEEEENGEEENAASDPCAGTGGNYSVQTTTSTGSSSYSCSVGAGSSATSSSSAGGTQIDLATSGSSSSDPSVASGSSDGTVFSSAPAGGSASATVTTGGRTTTSRNAAGGGWIYAD
jgi:prepilin-type N-terminal cleavage/methylation domain-containing protein